MALDIQLPYSIVTRADVGRLVRELQALDEAVQQNNVRGNVDKILPTSRLLDELAAYNKLNLLQQPKREKLQTFLEHLRSDAPLIHVSFSADPSSRFITSLMTWLRREIHPEILLQIGLEPALGAGCILRTTNRSFDFSLRKHFDSQRELLVAKIIGDKT